MIVAKVELAYKVTAFIKGESEEQIQAYLCDHTPDEVAGTIKANHRYVDEDYNEDIVCQVAEDSDYDIDLTESKQ